MSETIGTTELTDGIDAYRYQRANFHLDKYLGGLIDIKQALIDYQLDVIYYVPEEH